LSNDMKDNTKQVIQNSILQILLNPWVFHTSSWITILFCIANILHIIVGHFHGFNITSNWLTSFLVTSVFVLSLSMTLLGLHAQVKEKKKENERLRNSRLMLFVSLYKYSALVNYLAQQCLLPEKHKENKIYKDWIDESYELFSDMEIHIGGYLDDFKQNPDAKSIYDFTRSKLKQDVKNPGLYDEYY
jgi:hypothetical protein